jgi:hypothetical protein
MGGQTKPNPRTASPQSSVISHHHPSPYLQHRRTLLGLHQPRERRQVRRVARRARRGRQPHPAAQAQCHALAAPGVVKVASRRVPWCSHQGEGKTSERMRNNKSRRGRGSESVEGKEKSEKAPVVVLARSGAHASVHHHQQQQRRSSSRTYKRSTSASRPACSAAYTRTSRVLAPPPEATPSPAASPGRRPAPAASSCAQTDGAPSSCDTRCHAAACAAVPATS